MGILSKTGLLPCRSLRDLTLKQKVSTATNPDLRCEVTPAPFILRPYAALYNPFSNRCSVLCNHPVGSEAKECVKRAKDAWNTADEKGGPTQVDDPMKHQDGPDKNRTYHQDIVTEEMFRRYAETDSRPLTPAPTLASGKSRGSRRCLTPDHPPPRTTIVVDLRRSHSQETIYYHGCGTSDMTAGHTSATNDRSTLPSLNLSDSTHARLIKGQTEQLPPLASPLVLAKRAERPAKEANSVKAKKPKESNPAHLTPKAPLHHAPPAHISSESIDSSSDLYPSDPDLLRVYPSLTSKSRTNKPPRKRVKSVGSASTVEATPTPAQPPVSILKTKSETEQLPADRAALKVHFALAPIVHLLSARSIETPTMSPKFPNENQSCSPFLKSKMQRVVKKIARFNRQVAGDESEDLTDDMIDEIIYRIVKQSQTESLKNQNQVKALNLNKGTKGKGKGTGDTPASQRSKSDKEKEGLGDSEMGANDNDDSGSIERRRGKRRRKGRQSDRLTSAGLAAHSQQDPETQIAGISTDSHNPSSRGSLVPAADDDVIVLPAIKPAKTKKTDSFLDDDILKYLHREVDEEAIETEFDDKRRHVLEEALRTRPERPHGAEMQRLLRELKVAAVSLGDWLHIPRVFSRQNAHFALPIDASALEELTPMQYAAKFITLKKSKQLLYLTVLRKFRPEGYIMPKKDIEAGLILMMGGLLTSEDAAHFKQLMGWDEYQDLDKTADDVTLALIDASRKHGLDAGDTHNDRRNAVKYRTWCGLCAICERMFGKFPPRDVDPPDGMEISDFAMMDTKLKTLKVHKGLVEILNVIRQR